MKGIKYWCAAAMVTSVSIAESLPLFCHGYCCCKMATWPLRKTLVRQHFQELPASCPIILYTNDQSLQNQTLSKSDPADLKFLC